MVENSKYKQVMRQLASGVTIITARSSQEMAGYHAMTATAFLPVSLDPPLVMISVERSNDSHDIIAACTHFGVTLLSEHQEFLSNRYAKKEPDRYMFDDVPTFLGPNESLFFKGCSAAIEASVESQMEGGDHTLFLGRVVWMDAYPDARPLVYYQTKYHGVMRLDRSTHAPTGGEAYESRRNSGERGC